LTIEVPSGTQKITASFRETAPTTVTITGRYVDLTTPSSYVGIIQGTGVMEKLDKAYELLWELTDIRPYGGDKILVILDPDMPEGLSYAGNPIRVGKAYWSETAIPDVIYHEMGHDFMGIQEFDRLIFPVSPFVEGFANVGRQYVVYQTNRPKYDEDGARYLRELKERYLDHPEIKAVDMDGGSATGILQDLTNRYGFDMWKRFFRTIYNVDVGPKESRTVEERCYLFVKYVSEEAGEDLTDYFVALRFPLRAATTTVATTITRTTTHPPTTLTTESHTTQTTTRVSFSVHVVDAVSGSGISSASVWLDGSLAGTTGSNGNLGLSTTYPPADHSYRVSVNGYEDSSGTWTIGLSSTGYTVRLTRQLTSNSVYFDCNMLGDCLGSATWNTPVSRGHSFQLSFKDGATLERTLRVEVGESTPKRPLGGCLLGHCWGEYFHPVKSTFEFAQGSSAQMSIEVDADTPPGTYEINFRVCYGTCPICLGPICFGATPDSRQITVTVVQSQEEIMRGGVLRHGVPCGAQDEDPTHASTSLLAASLAQLPVLREQRWLLDRSEQPRLWNS
jgi:hypothetical protein